MTRPDQVVSAGFLFFLTFSIPPTWLKLPSDDGSLMTSSHVIAMCFPAVAFALSRMHFEIGPIIAAIRQEAFLPLLIGWILLSAFWSVAPGDAGREGLVFVLLAIFGYWLGTRFTLSSILGVMTVVLIAGTVLQLYLIRFQPAYAASVEAWTGSFKDKNIFGRHLAFSIVILLLAARLHLRFRLPIYATIAANAYLLLRADSQTALVAATATPLLAVVFVMFRARRTLYGAVALAVPAVFAAAVGLVIANISGLARLLGRNGSFSGRTDIWEAVWIEAVRRPVFGYGWRGFFTNDLGGPARHVYVKVLRVPHSHNALLDMFVLLGAVGATLMAVLFVRTLIRSARVIRFYRGAAGLFPIVFIAYAIISSITEYGVIRNDSQFVFLVVAIVGAQPGRRDQLDLTGVRSLVRPTTPSSAPFPVS